MPEAKPEAQTEKPLDLNNPDDAFTYMAMSERTKYGSSELGKWFTIKHLSDLPALRSAGFEIKRKRK